MRSWYVVRLWHPEPAKAIELARAKDPALIERRARDWAGRLGLPLSWQQYEPTTAATRRAERRERDRLGDRGGQAAVNGLRCLAIERDFSRGPLWLRR